MISKIKRFLYRDPDVTLINPSGTVYLRRWWVIPRNPYLNIYLHQFLADDEDRALHDHPWPSMSIILKGGYIEHMFVPGYGHETMQVARKVGRFIFRKATHAHRVELNKTVVCTSSNPDVDCGDDRCKWHHLKIAIPAWTLFITGPWQRTWGFICPQGWRHWRVFLNVPHGNAKGDERGPGCGETL